MPQLKPYRLIPAAVSALFFAIPFSATPALSTQEPTPATQESVSRDDLNAIHREIRELRAGQQAVQHDLDQLESALRELIRALENAEIRRDVEPDSDVLLGVDDRPFLGRVDAPVTVFELSDFE